MLFRSVAPAVADIELRSVQLFSVPRSVSVFDMAAAPSDDPDDYTDCPEVELSGQQAADDCYLLPNMQGTVSAITDQRQKNPENAPANASYLLIRAVRGSKILAYYIYLGGNNTSDFKVCLSKLTIADVVPTYNLRGVSAKANRASPTLSFPSGSRL